MATRKELIAAAVAVLGAGGGSLATTVTTMVNWVDDRYASRLEVDELAAKVAHLQHDSEVGHRRAELTSKMFFLMDKIDTLTGQIYMYRGRQEAGILDTVGGDRLRSLESELAKVRADYTELARQREALDE